MVLTLGHFAVLLQNGGFSYSSRIPFSKLQVLPLLSKPEPVEFYIDFVVDKFRIQYGVVMNLGLFLDTKHERKIPSKVLTVNGNAKKQTGWISAHAI